MHFPCTNAIYLSPQAWVINAGENPAVTCYVKTNPKYQFLLIGFEQAY